MLEKPEPIKLSPQHQFYGVPNHWDEFLTRVAIHRGMTSQEVLLQAIIEFYDNHYEEANNRV